MSNMPQPATTGKDHGSICDMSTRDVGLHGTIKLRKAKPTFPSGPTSRKTPWEAFFFLWFPWESKGMMAFGNSPPTKMSRSIISFLLKFCLGLVYNADKEIHSQERKEPVDMKPGPLFTVHPFQFIGPHPTMSNDHLSKLSQTRLPNQVAQPNQPTNQLGVINIYNMPMVSCSWRRIQPIRQMNWGTALHVSQFLPFTYRRYIPICTSVPRWRHVTPPLLVPSVHSKSFFRGWHTN